MAMQVFPIRLSPFHRYRLLAIPLLALILLHFIFYQKLSYQEALLQANEQTNHMNWILGHLVTCRYMLANSLGLKIEDPNGKLYFQPIGEHIYPDLAGIQDTPEGTGAYPHETLLNTISLF